MFSTNPLIQFSEWVDVALMLNSAQRNLNQFLHKICWHFCSLRIGWTPLEISFTFEQEKNGKLSFLDIEVSREKGKFVTTVYRKPTFSGVYTHFESFLPTIYKFGMVYTLAYRCFKICSDWTKFHEELRFLKQVFLENGYPLSFIDLNCFKTFADKLLISFFN